MSEPEIDSPIIITETITSQAPSQEMTSPTTEVTSEVTSAAPETAAASAPVAEAPQAPATVVPAAAVFAEPVAMTEEEAEAAAAAEAEAFGQLVDSYSQRPDESIGTAKHGRVVKLTATDVIVDIGLKGEGLVAIDEFKDLQGNITVQPGDEIDVVVMASDDATGYIRLSYAKVKNAKIWAELEVAAEANKILTCKVLEKTKGGLAVDIGVRAFLPGSQIDVRPVRELDPLVGMELPVRIIKINAKRGNVVVSCKVLLEEDLNSRKAETLAKLSEGALVTGVVKNLTEYGAFVDLGGIDGLLHITDMSWGRIGKAADVLTAGQQIEVKILKFDVEKERVSLGIKQMTEDPWLLVAERYVVGNRVKGKIISVTDYGAFVELEAGIEGLVHVSEMSWSKRLKHPSKIVSKDAEVEAVILDVNPKDRRISLGIKQTQPNPWATLPERYAEGTIIEGRVRNLTEFGAFVEVEEGIDGLIHVSDLSWTTRVKHPSDVLKKGEMIKAVVLKIDTENLRLSLGVKQLQPDAWQQYCGGHQVGEDVRGKIMRKTDFGVFVELSEGVEGLCHISELFPLIRNRAAIPFEVGEEHDFRILKVSPEEHKIGLSMKALHAEELAALAEKERAERPARREGARPGGREGGGQRSGGKGDRGPRGDRPPRSDRGDRGSSAQHSNPNVTSTIGDLIALKERLAAKNNN
ncbi:MAG: 30S ribosomal protein S1 [Acidobacteria bacterium]|nr:30S ribosomal protein S1 [Acidobacteriota bacterium]